jgi:hypothetical protein
MNAEMGASELLAINWMPSLIFKWFIRVSEIGGIYIYSIYKLIKMSKSGKIKFPIRQLNMWEFDNSFLLESTGKNDHLEWAFLTIL